jgi:Thiamine pyrophosphokinase
MECMNSFYLKSFAKRLPLLVVLLFSLIISSTWSFSHPTTALLHSPHLNYSRSRSLHPRPPRIKTISTKSTSSLNIMGCSSMDNPDSTSSTSTTSSRTPLGKENGGDYYAKPHIFRSPFFPPNDNCTVWKYGAHDNLDSDNDTTDNHIFDDDKDDPLHNAEETYPPKTVVAMIILNSPIANPPSPIFQTLWNLSSFRICADGGANRLYDATVLLHHNIS